MKIIKRLVIVILVLLVLCLIGGFVFYKNLEPTLEGNLTLKGLEKEVEVYFDEYGIPHIYAQNETDAQFALGYVHAQDRLFQMEMMRRLGKGRLAEILGAELVKTDRFFRTLGTHEAAKRGTERFNNLEENNPMKKAALAYHAGINSYIKNGSTPIEYHILGIEKEPFTIEDSYAIFGYMAFSFAQAFRTDPLVTRIHEKYGEAYLKDLDVHWNPAAQVIPTFDKTDGNTLLSDHFNIDQLFETLPVSPFIGSNAWVIGPTKTKNGKVLFSNDTHIGYSSPSVWYEAHIEYPGKSMYGNYLGGIPFPAVGFNRHHAIGLTMLENDDIDFYLEKINPENPNQVRYKDQWVDMEVRKEIIQVKDSDNITFEVKTTRHGPIVNEALDHVSNTTNQPVSAWWIYNEFLPENLESSYQMLHANSMEEVKKAASLGHAPGLNIMYGDVEGNIAWWSYGKLPIRPDHVNSKLFLDGSTGEDEILGYVGFEDNPHSENPPSGFVYSANNQPDTMAGVFHSGYYIPEDRARRIMDILEENDTWDMPMAQEMINDVHSDMMKNICRTVADIVRNDSNLKANETKAVSILTAASGEHALDDIAPTIYAKILYHILKNAMYDELGEQDFETLMETHLIKRSIPFLIQNDTSIWWDNIETADKTESRNELITNAFKNSIAELEAQLGDNMEEWKWSKVHTLEHGHVLGKVETLREYFNVGPYPIAGSSEVINNQHYRFNGSGKYEVYAGPAIRRIIDFGDLENSINILPTGNSGNITSPHYDDQAQLFVNGQFRKQKINREEIIKDGKKLVLKPN